MAQGRTYGGRCGSNACVQVTEVDDRFVFTSTIEGNDGAVRYEPAEVADFIADVKAGSYDQLLSDARSRAAAATVA